LVLPGTILGWKSNTLGLSGSMVALTQWGGALTQARSAPRKNHHGPHGRAWMWALDARLGRRADRVRAALDAAGALYHAERIHGVRVALKKLRYVARAPTNPSQHGRAREL